MSEPKPNMWAQIAGKLLGQIAAVYFAVAFAVVILIIPTKALWMFCSWIWNMF